MIKSFFDTACKNCTFTNIVHAFNKRGVSPIIPLSSDYTMGQVDKK